MLFEVDQKNGVLTPVKDRWQISELDLERYIFSSSSDSPQSLNTSVFSEELLMLTNQVRTSKNKRADILAIDRMGNAVIIELKRDYAALGVDTQALQYLADFSRYKGEAFLNRFAATKAERDTVLGFLGSAVTTDRINSSSRIILIAQAFDSTLYAMGDWLSSKGVGFRCIAYHPIQVGEKKFISFNLTFDRSPESVYPLQFSVLTRQPRLFWHNIGFTNDDWWQLLKTENIVTAGFDGTLGDQGTTLLRSYVIGDQVIAYCKGYGAVGVGQICEDPIATYRLLTSQEMPLQHQEKHLHRIKIKWIVTSQHINLGMAAGEIRDKFGIFHPLSTSVSIDPQKGQQLISCLAEKFG